MPDNIIKPEDVTIIGPDEFEKAREDCIESLRLMDELNKEPRPEYQKCNKCNSQNIYLDVCLIFPDQSFYQTNIDFFNFEIKMPYICNDCKHIGYFTFKFEFTKSE